ncbi:MAG: hypothetical protein K2R98_04440 [Gemmataceae bacterium]|nr:hypothetical protein [Gemmataceae bacterium]
MTKTSRTPEPATANRWLYVWAKREDAERFAKELRKRTKVKSWRVDELAEDLVSEGPLGPVDIYINCHRSGCTFGLPPNSRKLIQRKFPDARLTPRVSVGHDAADQTEGHMDGSVWDHVALILTGLTREQLEELGGYRVYEPMRDRVLRKPPSLAAALN